MDRTDVQCLHRWQKVLNPNLTKGPWTKDEDDVVNEAEACALMAHSVWQETLLAALDDATARYLELARMQ